MVEVSDLGLGRHDQWWQIRYAWKMYPKGWSSIILRCLTSLGVLEFVGVRQIFSTSIIRCSGSENYLLWGVVSGIIGCLTATWLQPPRSSSPCQIVKTKKFSGNWQRFLGLKIISTQIHTHIHTHTSWEPLKEMVGFSFFCPNYILCYYGWEMEYLISF